jgi:hypothetical protein
MGCINGDVEPVINNMKHLKDPEIFHGFRFACKYGHRTVIDYILKYKQNMPSLPLGMPQLAFEDGVMWACEGTQNKNNINTVRYLLEKSADKHIKINMHRLVAFALYSLQRHGHEFAHEIIQEHGLDLSWVPELEYKQKYLEFLLLKKTRKV